MIASIIYVSYNFVVKFYFCFLLLIAAILAVKVFLYNTFAYAITPIGVSISRRLVLS